jgi:transcriptional regulator with XRE-family HTH domain
MDSKIDLGKFIHQLRKERNYTLKFVADKLEMDLSLLSKIENGERQIQKHMLKGISEVFELDFKKLQIDFINNRIESEFGSDPYFKESIKQLLNR